MYGKNSKLKIQLIFTAVILIFLSFIFSLIFSTFVFAFDVESKIITNVVCPSSTIIIEEKVSAREHSSFEVLVAGSSSSFATALPVGFELDKGESKSIYIYITPPSTILPGKYSLLVTIKGEGTSKTLNHEIIVENCNEISLNIETAKEVCACESVEYIAKIKNKGLYTERYSLELLGQASEFGKLSTNSLSLSSGEEKTIKITFNPSCNAAAKTYDFTLKVTSLDSRSLATADGKINVKNCFGYTLDAEKNYYRVCDGEKINAVFVLTNKGGSDNYYEINFKGPNFANVDKNSIAVGAGKKGEINVFIAPKLGEKAGNYSIEIETFSEKGKIIAKEKAVVEVVECHKGIINFLTERKEDKICNALENNYGIEIKNTGEKTQDIKLNIEGAAWASLSNTTMLLEPGQTKSVLLKVAPPYDTPAGKYEIKVTAKDRNSELELSDKILIETLTREDCYRPKIETKEDNIIVEKDKTHVLILTIENTGAEPATYIIDISGNANRFVSLNPSIIKLNPKNSENIYVYIAPSLTTPVGKYTLTVSARLNNTVMLASKTVNIEVVEKRKEESVKPENITITEKEVKKEKKSIWKRIVEWFKGLFKGEEKEGEEKEEATAEKAIENVSKNESKKNESKVEKNISNISVSNDSVKTNVSKTNISKTNISVNQSNVSKSEVKSEKKEGESEINESEILKELEEKESGIGKYRWIIIGVLAFIAFILLLSIFDVWSKLFGKLSREKTNNKKVQKEEKKEE